MSEVINAENWNGPVWLNGKAWRYLEDAVDEIESEGLDVTEVECMRLVPLHVSADSILEDLDSDFFGDDDYPSDYVGDEHRMDLQKFLDEWCALIPYERYEANGKFIDITKQVAELKASKKRSTSDTPTTESVIGK